MPQTSQNVARLEPSATLAVAARARELAAAGRDIVNLSAGEPDFATPDFAASAGIAAIRDGHTRYTAAAGMPELRQAIARYLAIASGRDMDPAGVIVSAGAKQALFNAIFTLFGPGDRVAIPAPYWTSYPALVHLSRAEPHIVDTRAETDFKLAGPELDELADAGVRGLILNSPANPTGAVYSRDELLAVAEWAAREQVWLISDEIYGRLCYTGERAPGMLDLPEELLERCVIIDGASKLFAMTGWRIGFSYSDPALASAMSAVQSHMTSNAATPSQYAALAAFERDPLERDEVRAMVDQFGRRRDLVVRLFEELLPGAEFVRPEGAFYLFFRVDGYFGEDVDGSVALCSRLLDEAGVALVPGAAFGDDRYARMSYAASEQTIEAGVRRMAQGLERIAAAAGAAVR